MRFFCRFAAFLLGSMLVASAQQPAEGPASTATITVDAKLVVVPAVVRDKKNALVPGLTRESFALLVDGKPQAVRYFDHDADAPLTVGLLIDSSMSQRNVLDDERAASATFLDKMLVADRDTAFLIQFARSVALLQDVTASRGKLQQALKQVDVPKPTFQRPASGDGSTTSADPEEERRERFREIMSQVGTKMYDAVLLASEQVIAKEKGRRALILLTDGDDHGSVTTLAKAIEAAQRADTMVYAIYYKDDNGGGGIGGRGLFGGGMGGRRGGMGGYGQQVDGRKVLERMCGETGGRVFEVSKKETVDKIYAEIGEELRSQYRLGFTPTADAASEGYHQIVLGLTGPPVKSKDTVQARDGYYKR